MSILGVEDDSDTLICSVYRSEHIEAIIDAVDALAYRCLDCEAEFDETGARVVP